jgi:small subunit ribosomal protein S19e
MLYCVWVSIVVSVREVPADLFISRLAEKLREEMGERISPPPWAIYVKTGVSKERPPDSVDWWYVRAASILRKLYISGEPLGIERLRTIYGSRKRRGSAPPHFRKAGGSIIRKILQQLERAGLVARTRKGRVLTPRGRSYLDNVAFEVYREAINKHPELIKYGPRASVEVG